MFSVVSADTAATEKKSGIFITNIIKIYTSRKTLENAMQNVSCV